MIQIRATHRTGFEVVFEVPDLAAVDGMISELQRQGYRPTLAGDGWQRTPDGLPLCPKHGAVMTKREKQVDAWHSHRVIDPRTGEEHYCRGYPTGKAGDGYAS
jgi:hypothetical protein